jgi:hypothetical protein
MRAAKTFAYVAAGILALAGAFALGAQTAQGQSPGGLGVVGYAYVGSGSHSVMLENGDVYYSSDVNMDSGMGPSYVGNFWGSAPTQATETTWGRIKAERR